VGGVPTNQLDALTVDENATVNLELWMNQVNDAPQKKISMIQINLGGGDLDLTGAGMNASWTWDGTLVGTYFNGSTAPFPDNDVSDDGIVAVLADPTDPEYRPGASLIQLGSLSFTAPAYVGPGPGPDTYTLDFETGGTYPTALGSSGAPSDVSGSSSIGINVMPEPATLGLLCLGGASLLLRRRR
ncbi:MAG: PEP-CTERM sorting domain-containing protein, partial [Planctomycetota bacterium]|nr:PEP-CTERM sorting domain-containing protein [Planctomycetota bacterium]